MSIEENKAIIRRLEKVWNTRESDALQEIIAPDYVNHWAGHTTRPESGPDWYRQFAAHNLAQFPDLRVTIEDLLADGDRVASRWTVRGTSRGPSATPWGAVPPTGTQIAWPVTIIARIAGGKIAEEWWQADDLGRLRQLGVLPPSTPAAAEQQTKAVFDHHWQAYMAKDLDGILSDYTEESVVVVNVAPEPLKGLAAIRGLYAQAMEMLIPEVLSQVKIARQAVYGEIGYIAFSAGSAAPLISDTFVIRGGKIVVQTTVVQMGQGS